MKVDRIDIRGYKSIKEANIELQNLNVLIGPNGLNEMYNSNLQLYTTKSGGASSLRYFGRKQTPAMSAKTYFSDNSYYFSLSPTDEDEFVFESERVSWKGDYFGDYVLHP
jgi:predicted ATPase